MPEVNLLGELHLILIKHPKENILGTQLSKKLQRKQEEACYDKNNSTKKKRHTPVFHLMISVCSNMYRLIEHTPSVFRV